MRAFWPLMRVSQRPSGTFALAQFRSLAPPHLLVCGWDGGLFPVPLVLAAGVAFYGMRTRRKLQWRKKKRIFFCELPSAAAQGRGPARLDTQIASDEKFVTKYYRS
jgi:hypothetical protein